MRRIILTLIIISFTIAANAQNVKLKKDKVLLDGIEILSFKKVPRYNEVYFYNLNTTEEVVFIRLENNGTFEYDGDNFVKVFFAKSNIRIESKSLHFGAKGEETIKKLIFEGVIENDGSINSEKLNSFFEKYNDIITK